MAVGCTFSDFTHASVMVCLFAGSEADDSSDDEDDGDEGSKKEFAESLIC